MRKPAHAHIPDTSEVCPSRWVDGDRPEQTEPGLIMWRDGIEYLSGFAFFSGRDRYRLRSMYLIMKKISIIVMPNPCALCKAHLIF